MHMTKLINSYQRVQNDKLHEKGVIYIYIDGTNVPQDKTKWFV